EATSKAVPFSARVATLGAVKRPTSLRAVLSPPGFTVAAKLKGVFGDRYARVVVLRRRKKLGSARAAGSAAVVASIVVPYASAIWGSPGGGSGWSSNAGASGVPAARTCS